MTSAAPARATTANAFTPAQEHRSVSCPVRSLRVVCHDYLKRRPNREVPREGVKERVIWGIEADAYDSSCRIKGVRVAMAQSHLSLGCCWWPDLLRASVLAYVLGLQRAR